jgi:Uma2 family endonuclease
MDAAGLFGGRRVELVEGEVLAMAAQATPHRASITKISQLLLNAFTARDWVVIQGTLLLPPSGAPDPDFHVFDVPIGTPDDRLPVPILVIEVSDSTYARDSGPKLRMYARAGIADYWIVNLNLQRVEVYRRPENPTGKRLGWRYADRQVFEPGEIVSPLGRPALRLDVRGMLS